MLGDLTEIHKAMHGVKRMDKETFVSCLRTGGKKFFTKHIEFPASECGLKVKVSP